MHIIALRFPPAGAVLMHVMLESLIRSSVSNVV